MLFLKLDKEIKEVLFAINKELRKYSSYFPEDVKLLEKYEKEDEILNK